MEETHTSPEDHIASLSAERRPTIEQLDALISSVLAGRLLSRPHPKRIWLTLARALDASPTPIRRGTQL